MRQRIASKLEKGQNNPRKQWQHERLVILSYHWLKKVAGCERIFVEPWVKSPHAEHPDIVGYKGEFCYVVECKPKPLGRWIQAEREKWRFRPLTLGHYRWFAGPANAVLGATKRFPQWQEHGALVDTGTQLEEWIKPTLRDPAEWTGDKELFRYIESRYGRKVCIDALQRAKNLRFDGPGEKPPQKWYQSLPYTLESDILLTCAYAQDGSVVQHNL